MSTDLPLFHMRKPGPLLKFLYQVSGMLLAAIAGYNFALHSHAAAKVSGHPWWSLWLFCLGLSTALDHPLTTGDRSARWLRWGVWAVMVVSVVLYLRS